MGSSVDKKRPPKGGGECGGFYTPPGTASTLIEQFSSWKFNKIHER
jgi:hypothetical protein